MMRRALVVAAVVALGSGAGPARAQSCSGNANKVTAAGPLSIADAATQTDLDNGSIQHRITVSVQNGSTVCANANTADMGRPAPPFAGQPPKPVSDVEVWSYYYNTWLPLSATPQAIAVAVAKDTAFTLRIRTAWTDLPGTYRTGMVLTAWSK